MHRTSTENVKHKYDDKYAEKSHSEFCVESLTLYNVAMCYKVFVISWIDILIYNSQNI